MAVNVRALEAAQEAQRRVPRVIKALMAFNDTTHRELADALGMTQPALSDRLNGKRKMTYTELAGIAAYFGVPVGTLYESSPQAAVQRSTWKPAVPGQRPDPVHIADALHEVIDQAVRTSAPPGTRPITANPRPRQGPSLTVGFRPISA